ncbi:hypothetical protein Ahia01_001302900 [Argonauta hians]
MALDLLVQERQNWGHVTCMFIAVNADNKKFISQTACQSLLSNIWMGDMKENNSKLLLFFCTICPLLIFLIKFTDKFNNEEDSKIFYIIFLSIYSYVLLVELGTDISVLEWILLVWVITIFTEEIHQMLAKDSPSFWTKFIHYLQDTWNIIDVLTITLFIAGFILRHVAKYDAARVVLSLDLISYYIRILRMFSIHQELGPKLVMIKKMMQDLAYFFVILFVFMVAYGITSQSILCPRTEVSYELFKGVFRKAYFQMYGELFLEEYEEGQCCGDKTKCSSQLGLYIAPLMMGLYILLTNILLLNLLIAMFSYTFQNVQENTDLHWNFQRYGLIFEFYTRPPLPPPLILLNHIYLLCKYLYRKKTNKEYENKKTGFRQRFDKNEEKRLLHWEDEIADSYLSRKEKSNNNSMYEKVISSSNRIDQLTQKVEELQHQLQTLNVKTALLLPLKPHGNF